jgi:hypothetical protein
VLLKRAPIVPCRTNSKHTASLGACMLLLFIARAAFGQHAAPRTIARAVVTPQAPTITILSAATGALIRSHGAGNAVLDFGPVSYFKRTSPLGESFVKNSRSFVISAGFELKVDCPGGSTSSQVNVTMTRLDADPSHTVAIDGATLGQAPQTLVAATPCGSTGEHRLDVEVPVSTPAGSIGSMIVFAATLKGRL